MQTSKEILTLVAKEKVVVFEEPNQFPKQTYCSWKKSCTGAGFLPSTRVCHSMSNWIISASGGAHETIKRIWNHHLELGAF